LGDILIILWIFLQNFIQKYEFILNVGPKVKMKNFRRTKSWKKKNLEKLKWKVGLKTYLTHFIFFRKKLFFYIRSIWEAGRGSPLYKTKITFQEHENPIRLVFPTVSALPLLFLRLASLLSLTDSLTCFHFSRWFFRFNFSCYFYAKPRRTEAPAHFFLAIV